MHSDGWLNLRWSPCKSVLVVPGDGNTQTVPSANQYGSREQAEPQLLNLTRGRRQSVSFQRGVVRQEQLERPLLIGNAAMDGPELSLCHVCDPAVFVDIFQVDVESAISSG